MTFQRKLLCAVAVSGFAAFAAAAPAQALSMQECSAKYKAAKDAGTLNGQKWNDFRKAQCAADATPGGHPCRRGAGRSRRAEGRRSQAEEGSRTCRAAPAATGNAVFPSAIDPKYASESAGKGRMHTCLDQYHTNKTNNTNGGLKWIAKGGGYYSECNKRLKG